jgi:LacI family gluconate utilization system Gnt-I transcriptional repressor
MKAAKDMRDPTKQKPRLDDAGARRRRNTGRMTLRDVAGHLGISQISVSRYFQEPERLSEELRERIRSAVAELGYVPNLVAGGLASARSRVIGMVLPNISGPIFAETIQSFSDAVTARGYQLLLASSYFSAELEENAVRAFLGWSPAALVLTSYHHSAATEEMIARSSIPVIETWDFQPDRAPIQIGFSHVDVGRLAANYLVEKGYRRIAFVQNSVAGDISALDRRDGYIEVMRENGRKPWTFVPTEGLPFHAGRQALEALVNRRQPADAIIFANDNLASGALLAARRAGVDVPGKCAIIGFGDYAFSEMLSPSLTTIRPPAREIGERAAATIFRMVDQDESLTTDGDEGRLHALPCELIERESTCIVR